MTTTRPHPPGDGAPSGARRAPAPRPLGVALAAAAVVLIVLGAVLGAVAVAGPAGAQEAPVVTTPTVPTPGAGDGQPDGADASVSIDLGGGAGAPSQSILIIILLTLLAVAPALLVMLSSFTRIVIVLSLTRNAMGLQGIPPNQVLVGLALFLSLFVMAPTLSTLNETALQPLLRGEIAQGDAYTAAVTPLREFMLEEVGEDELSMFVQASAGERPATPDDVELNALIPAFILSELKTAFIIGFIIFIPFLVIDIVVSSSLMSMGMMMLPPVVVSMPFKLLLFVLVDGWGLVVRALIRSF